MHMIRHYAPCVEVISNPIEVSQSLSHLIGDGRLCEKATTGSGIQLLFDLFAEELFESSFFKRRQSSTGGFRGCDNVGPLEFKLPKHRLRQRVSKAKCNEIDRIDALPNEATCRGCERLAQRNCSRKEPAGRRRYGMAAEALAWSSAYRAR